MGRRNPSPSASERDTAFFAKGDPPTAGAVAAAARPPFRRILRQRFIWVVSGLLLGFSLLFTALVLLPVIEQRVNALFESYARVAQSGIAARFDQVTPLLAVVSDLFENQPPSVEEPERFLAPARSALATLPIATSIVVGNDRGQGWMVLWQEDRQQWWVRLTDRVRWGDEHRFIVYDTQWRPQVRWRQRLPYDPRERPWYRLATGETGRTRWTAPYIFYTTREPGITASRGWRDEAGQLWAVGFDLRLKEIGAAVQGLRGVADMVIAITDAEGHLLSEAADGVNALPLPTDDVSRLPKIGIAGHALLRQAASLRDAPDRLSTPWAVLWHEGRRWLWTVQPLALGEQRLALWLAAPWAEFLPPAQRWIGLLGIGVMLILSMGWMVAAYWSRQLAEPIEYLADAVDRMAHLAFDKAIRTQWRTAELHRLARAANHLRRRLVVYTGRLRQREAELAREVSALRAAEQRLLYVGLHDALTDLPNRRLLLEHLQHALARVSRNGACVALLFVDLDQFKEVNDTQGHESGDEVLREVARRLRATVRSGDVVARLGGDEFVVLIEEIHSDLIAVRADELLRVLREPIEIGGHRWLLDASIGIACGPRDGTDPSTLLRHADEAMYQAKRAGRARWMFYEAGFSFASRDIRSLREALHSALSGNGQLELWWQPQVLLHTGQAVAAEALLRWRHPLRGLIPPDQFVPLAEDANLMPALGDYVIDLALQAGARIDRAGLGWERLAVNVSVRQLEVPDFAGKLLQRLRDAQWPAQRLELEVTESALLESELAREQLRRLSAAGVRLALDDFGTGYSSLSYLRQLPFDTIKIDASFVREIGRGLQGDVLIQSLIGMAQGLGMELVAEGVETDGQRSFLDRHRVEYGQGYLWFRPQPLQAWIGVQDRGTA